LGANSLVGDLFQLAISPFSWMDAAMEGVGEQVGQMMETEADREPDEERPQHGGPQEEVLLVAKWQRKRRTARCPHRHGSRRRRGYSPARHQEYQAVVINQVGIAKGSVLDLVSQVRDAILMTLQLEVGNPGGSGFWSRGYMSKGREMGRPVYEQSETKVDGSCHS
jgi:hypothetical protein